MIAVEIGIRHGSCDEPIEAKASLEMTWEASMNYTNAKEEELQNRQRVGWKDSGVRDFVEGKFEPGLQSHETIKP